MSHIKNLVVLCICRNFKIDVVFGCITSPAAIEKELRVKRIRRNTLSVKAKHKRAAI